LTKSIFLGTDLATFCGVFEILLMRLRVVSSKSDESEDWFEDEVVDSISIILTEFEGEKNHKKGGLNCVLGNFFFYLLDNCPQVQSLK